MTDIERQLRGYRLTTAEVLYHLPDHPAVLQCFTWQQLDLAPRFPILRRFLDYWVANIEGKLHSVRIASSALIRPAEWQLMRGEFRIH